MSTVHTNIFIDIHVFVHCISNNLGCERFPSEFVGDSTRFAFLAAAWLLIMPVAHWEVFEWWGFWHGIFYMWHVVIGKRTWWVFPEGCWKNTRYLQYKRHESHSHCKFVWRMPSVFVNEPINDFGIPSYLLTTGHLGIYGSPCLCTTHPSKFIMLFSSEDSWHREAVRSPEMYRCSLGRLKASVKLTWLCGKSPLFSRKYIYSHGPCSIATVV